MSDNSGALSIDFLVGFTIFILAFIWVATMIPNLFIGLSSHTIDFDAVAYRTGVILAEDPGATSHVVSPTDPKPWEAQNLSCYQPGNPTGPVARFGLAISKDSPDILDAQKVKSFFNTTAFHYPDDYQACGIFGDYPYRFNVTLTVVGDDKIWRVGDVIPDDHSYGYIRRDVKIKGWSNATINTTPPKIGQACVTFNQYSIKLDSNELRYGSVRDPSYQIIPQKERIIINISGLNGSMNQSSSNPAPVEVNLSKIQFYERYWGNDPTLHVRMVSPFSNFTYVNGSSTAVGLPVSLGLDRNIPSNISLILEPQAFSDFEDTSTIYINLTFGINPPEQYFNNTREDAFNYTYTSKYVTPPSLRDGVLEVAVW